MENTIEETIKELVSKQVNISADEIKREHLFRDDLGGDSLDEIELIMQIEEHFDFEVSDDQSVELQTVGDIIDHTKKQLLQKEEL